MTKVLFCTNGIFPHAVGGVQRHNRMLIEYLAKYDDISLTVIHPHRKEKIFGGVENINEIHLPKIKNGKPHHLMTRYEESKKVYEIIEDHPDYAVYSPDFSVWYGIDNVKERLIFNPHGLEAYQPTDLKNRLIVLPYRFAVNHLLKYPRYVVSLGGKLTDILHPRINKKHTELVVIPNAISMPKEVTVPKSFGKPLKFLFVGRFAYNKGIHILMQAIDELNKKGYGNDCQFILAGKGPLYEKYKNECTYSNVSMPGFVTDEELFNYYKSCDVFVFPTLFEGMPTVVLEAMSYGMPVIVSDVGATAELVNNENGYLMKKNKAAELAQRICHFAEQPASKKEAMSKASYEKVKTRFTWDIVAAEYREIFKNI